MPRIAVAGGLVLLFLAIAMNVAPIVPGTHWWQFWPVGLLIVGLALIIVPVRGRFETVWHVAGVTITSLAATMLPMSLGMVAWETFAYAFRTVWPLIAFAVTLFILGVSRDADALLIIGSFFIVAFCLVALAAFSVPGDVASLFVHIPNGRSVRIALGF